MLNLVSKNKSIKSSNRRIDLINKSVLPTLQEKIDQAEKQNQNPFHDFNDIEILQWFLLKREYLDETKDRSERTIREYERELKQFVQYLLAYAEDIRIDIDNIKEGSLFKSLDKRHIRRYQEWLVTRSPYVLKHGPYSPATIARKTTILKSFLHFLYKEGYIEKPIHEGLKKATVRKDDRPNRDLGPQEIKQLLDYFRENHHPIAFAIIHILVTTGIRNEEFCRLKGKDLKFDTISGGYYLDILGKGNKRRQVPLREKTVESIRLFRKARGLKDIGEIDTEEPLFTTNQGRPYSPSYLSQYLKKVIYQTDLPFLKNLSLQITPHTFRHSFSIISRLSGADVYQIMRSLGHEKIETTMIYLEKIFEKENHVIHQWNKEIFGEYI
ncbi:tyrosine-type recombinase/integrase [Parageobacillus thermoglucosidasius]|jgi:site-specific recombinase XerD|uniref:tyrosine-type recombinase/integrase n=1 Tax=Parageobacillus thermoglucosidasius TaxID=1426 RepID=UPI000B56340D|nr:tyrosine-type recombinase/integrase [Parageobacillus thermoglucosidasius]OUM90425.1 MAG: integrase [Parageobacillus thermoglucosidasius]